MGPLVEAGREARDGWMIPLRPNRYAARGAHGRDPCKRDPVRGYRLSIMLCHFFLFSWLYYAIFLLKLCNGLTMLILKE